MLKKQERESVISHRSSMEVLELWMSRTDQSSSLAVMFHNDDPKTHPNSPQLNYFQLPRRWRVIAATHSGSSYICLEVLCSVLIQYLEKVYIRDFSVTNTSCIAFLVWFYKHSYTLNNQEECKYFYLKYVIVMSYLPGYFREDISLV